MQGKPQQCALDPHRLNAKDGSNRIVPYMSIDDLENLAFQWKAGGGVDYVACAEQLELIIDKIRHRDQPPKLPKWLPAGVYVHHCGSTFQSVGELRLMSDDKVPCYTGLFKEVQPERAREDLFVVCAAEIDWTQYYRLIETNPTLK